MRFHRIAVVVAVALLLSGAGSAQQSKYSGKPGTPSAVVAKRAPERIEVSPAEVQLNSRRAYRQLVVTGYFQGEPHDLTQEAEYQLIMTQAAHPTNPPHSIVKIVNGRLMAAGVGSGAVVVRYGGRTAVVPVRVANYEQPEPVSFKFETLPILTKQGCANGSCHGSPHGKGGFSLSLFGYDPTIDRVSLTRDGFNRRTDVLEPGESLILKKPLLEIPHVGGKRLRKTDTGYGLLSSWIYEGANTDIPTTDCARIVVTPDSGRVLHAPFLKQQLSVVSSYTDGTTRDVSAIASYDTSNPAVATVDANGLVTAHGRGQAAISVRYLDKLQSVYITVVEDVQGFVWSNPPEFDKFGEIGKKPTLNFIDHLVDAKLKQLQYLPSPVCDDSTFVRRIYLDLTGLLPTLEQTRAFLKETSSDKRTVLIDRLLASEDYARFWASKRADLMRVSPARLKEGRADLFANWIIDSVRKNMPYDQFARTLLTAEGDSEHVAPANYFLAIPTRDERTEMTTQIFMGSRVECAKCHNHPFESWTMRDYYSIGAVWARVEDDNGEIKLAESGEATHPTTQQVMTPWGADPKTPAEADRRIAFVDWLTKPGNPYFARVEVNRIWADLLGRGIVDPVDDFRSSNPPSNVPLLDALAQEFERSGYDRKHILRMVCNSRTYQSSSQTNEFNASDETLFSHARMRMLTAEQLKDAIGYTTHVLEPTDHLQIHLAEARKQADARAATLEAKYPTWLEEKTKQVAGLPFWQGGWYLAGPFKAANLAGGMRATFGPESTPTRGDLNAAPGHPRWELRPAFKDGSNNLLSNGRNEVHFLTRRLYSTQAQPLKVELRSADGYMAWLNGKPLMEGKTLKGAQKLTLNLEKGENRLLVKTFNAKARATCTYRVSDDNSDTIKKVIDSSRRGFDVPPYFIDLLAIPTTQRTEEQRQLLHEQYLADDNGIRDLRRQVAQFEGRMNYATQRAYPESSEFTTTFGQPKRDTACTCERQHAPTLLQALELLNGGTAYQMAQAGANRYATLDNDKLIEELYLTALSRQPTSHERTIATGYLTRNTDRKSAVMDLVWTLVNTQEFLFQH